MVFTFPYLAKSIPMECRLPVETSILAAASLGTGCSHLSLVLSQRLRVKGCSDLSRGVVDFTNGRWQASPLLIGVIPVKVECVHVATVRLEV